MTSVGKQWVQFMEGVPVVQLDMVGQGAVMLWVAHFPLPYQAWIKLRKAATDDETPVGRMLLVRGNAILDLRTGVKTTRTVLAGSDPTVMSVDGRQIHIVNISFRSVPLRKHWVDCQGHRAQILVRADGELTEQFGHSVVTALKKALAIEVISVHIRNDPWFPDVTGAPLLPFGNLPELPTEDSYRRSRTLFCMEEGTSPSCTAIDYHY
jgi:hypothetical protein